MTCDMALKSIQTHKVSFLQSTPKSNHHSVKWESGGHAGHTTSLQPTEIQPAGQTGLFANKYTGVGSAQKEELAANVWVCEPD